MRLSAAIASSLFTAVLFGCLDSLSTLISEPYPGSTAFLLGYVMGPVLVSLSWALPLGTATAALRSRNRDEMPRDVATRAGTTVAAVWQLGLLVVAWAEGQPLSAIALICVAATALGIAFTRLARDAAGWLTSLPHSRQRAFWLGSTLLLGAAALSLAPSGRAAFSGGTGPCPIDGASVPKRPNILLITIDTLRVDAAQTMTSYRELASHGISFEQHLATSPWTLPSIVSLLTGLPVEEHGAGYSLSSRSLLARTSLKQGIPTVAERLGSEGYRTHAIVTNPYLTSSYGADRGFCSFENVTISAETFRGLKHTTPVRLVQGFTPQLLPNDRADTIRARAETWVVSHPHQPAFLWLHFLDPHAPYGDRPGSSTSLTLDLMALQRGRGLESPFREVGAMRAGEFRPNPRERERIVDLYRQDVAFLDQELQTLLTFLQTEPSWADAAIILTADHGEEFWEHGGVEHGRTLYEEVLRVPLVVRPPGGRNQPAMSVQAFTSVLDIAPTILGLGGAPFQSLSGRDLLRDRSNGPDHLILGAMLFGEQWTGVRTARFKYIRSEFGEERFFDMERDPRERANLAVLKTEQMIALTKLVPEIHATGSVAATPPPLSDAERQALKNLGYAR